MTKTVEDTGFVVDCAGLVHWFPSDGAKVSHCCLRLQLPSNTIESVA